MKRVMIGIIHLYQQVAPTRVRNSCRFEPSCSSFALIAIDKYGLKGSLIKTLGRLWRCRPPNGGIDVP
jgi:uncharacterized protein